MPNQRRAGLASIHVYQPAELVAAVKTEAAARGETVTAMINRACRNYTRKKT